MASSESMFDFSVIMVVDCESGTIEETMESIISQTLTFGRIQCILLAVGSAGRSEDVCRYYAEQYPGNVIYEHRKTMGVSAALNYGKRLASGMYTIFAEGGTMWSRSAFAEAKTFFDAHHDAIDMCTCRIDRVGNDGKWVHPLDYKYENGNMVVDLTERPDYVNTTLDNVIFKTSAIEQCDFDENMLFGQCAKFVALVLLETLQCGVISRAVLYRPENRTEESIAKAASDELSWFFDVPRDYYLDIARVSEQRYGAVLDYVQFVILYDLRSRLSCSGGEASLTDDQKQQYLSLMKEVLGRIPDKRIRKGRGKRWYNEYMKLYLLSLKHGTDLFSSYAEKKNQFRLGKVITFSPSCKTLISVQTILQEEGVLCVDGFCRNVIFGKAYPLHIVDDAGSEYEITYKPWPKADMLGFAGEPVVEGQWFHACIKAAHGRSVEFFVEIEGNMCKTAPQYSRGIFISGQNPGGYCALKDWLIYRRDQGFAIGEYSYKDHLRAEMRLKKSSKEEDEEQRVVQHQAYQLDRLVRRQRVKRRVAFVTARSDGKLEGNLAVVAELFSNSEKVVFAKTGQLSYDDKRRRIKAVYGSKVVVLDDYCRPLHDYDIDGSHAVVQLWHACGAFKKFGVDGTRMFPANDLAYHHRYGLVTTSSEEVRQIYADCFGIPVDRVRALGVPRTDVYHDSGYLRDSVKTVYQAYPALTDKRVILYAPTFRDSPYPRNQFVPDIDFEMLSEELPSNTHFVICPHPVMTDEILPRAFHNITEVRDIPTQVLMCASDLLVTDYSSVIMEYALLDKPILFYCYDYDTYDRDFYLDYDNDLPGRIVRSQEEFVSALNDEETYIVSDKMRGFIRRYMGACDGHSAERISAYIRELLDA